MKSSIRWKLAGSYFGIIIITMLLADWLAYGALRLHYLQERQQAYQVHANVVSTYAVDYIMTDQLSVLPKAVREYSEQVGARVLILNREGLVLGDSFNEDWVSGRKLSHQEVVSALQGQTAGGNHHISPDEWVMYVAVPVTKEKEVIGAVMLSTDITDIADSLNDVLNRMLILSLIGSILAGMAAYWLAERLTRPVEELTVAVERVAQGSLKQKVPVRSRDELGKLAKSFNIMAEKLLVVDRSRRDFIANASHELKSPLSSIKALAESLIYSDEKDVAVYKEYLTDINNEINRINHLVHELLEMARMEEDNVIVHKKLEYIDVIVDRVLHLVEKRAKEKNITITADVREKLSWFVDKDILEVIILNLVDNAVKYTPERGRVDIVARQQSENLLLQVADTGEGIPAEDIPHIFDRFYRVDKARSRETGGTGLGLSIVLQGVKLLGGSINVQSAVDEGSVFTVTLPRE